MLSARCSRRSKFCPPTTERNFPIRAASELLSEDSFMRRLSLLIVFVLGPLGVAHADRTLTLDEALALARANNKDLKAARARVDQAEVAIKQAWAALLPTASANGRY